MNKQTFKIYCSDCGIQAANSSHETCDCCGAEIVRINFGGHWYIPDELERDNPYDSDNISTF